MNSLLLPKKRTFIAYLIPGFLLYTFSVIIPVFVAMWYGFFNWFGGQKMTFIGLSNYIEICKDSVFWQCFKNNLLLVLICIVGQVGIGFILAALLSSKMIKIKTCHTKIAFLPSVFSAVVVGFIWNMIYDYNYGIINYTLKFLGRGDLCKSWLSEPKLALILVSIPLVWQYIGYYMIILTSAFASIDKEILEMATIDGANGFKRVVHITLPMVKNTVLVCLTLCIAGNMKAFDNIYVMTNGGPGNASNVMALYAYNTSFVRYRMGYGSAMSIVILILSLIVTGVIQLVISRLTKEKEA